MSGHQILVLYAGLVFMILAFIMFGCWKYLGPKYEDRITVGWKLRGAVFVGATLSFWRGITLVFPGKAGAAAHMPWIVPAYGTAFLVIATLATEWIAAHRAPPPVMERLQHAWAALAGRRSYSAFELADELMEASGPAMDGARPIRFGSRRLRRWVLLAASAGLMILVAVVLHAAAAELPR